MKEYTFNVRLLEDDPPRFSTEFPLVSLSHYEVEIDLPDAPYIRCEISNSLDNIIEVVKNTLGNADRTFVSYQRHENSRDKTIVGKVKARVYTASDFAELDKRITALEEKHDELEKEVRLLEQ